MITRWGTGAQGRSTTVADDRYVWTVSNATTLTAGFAQQASETLARLDASLEQAGSDRRHLLSVQVLLTDLANRDAFNDLWTTWIGPDPDHWPQRAVLGAALAPGLLVEIIATAARR